MHGNSVSHATSTTRATLAMVSVITDRSGNARVHRQRNDREELVLPQDSTDPQKDLPNIIGPNLDDGICEAPDRGRDLKLDRGGEWLSLPI